MKKHELPNRETIEKSIIGQSEKIVRDQETGCFNTAQINAYLESWYLLGSYYEETGDLTIAVEVVREYRESLQFLSAIQHNYAECSEKGEEYILMLESYMDRIIGAVDRKLYPNGR